MTRSGSKTTEGIAEDLEPQNQQDHHHDRRVVVGHERTNGAERSHRPTRSHEEEQHRTDTTVTEPMATNVATAMVWSALSSPARAIEADAVMVSARFFGLAADSDNHMSATGKSLATPCPAAYMMPA